jgi:hypothetical protein
VNNTQEDLLVATCRSVSKELKTLRRQNAQLKKRLELQLSISTKLQENQQYWEKKFFNCAPTEKVGEYIRERYEKEFEKSSKLVS